jgi:hypothetical protein
MEERFLRRKKAVGYIRFEVTLMRSRGGKRFVFVVVLHSLPSGRCEREKALCRWLAAPTLGWSLVAREVEDGGRRALSKGFGRPPTC